MRSLKSHIIPALIFIWLLSSCQRELDCLDCYTPPGTDTTGSVIKSEWQFDEDIDHFNGPVDTAYLNGQDNGEIIKISGISATGSEVFYISIKKHNGKLQTNETYTTKNEEVKFYYYNDIDTLYSAVPYYGGNLSVTITAIDSNKVQGIFSGIAMDEQNKSRDISIGSFSSPLKIAAPGYGKGSVILWAKQLCNGPVKIKVNDILGQINIISYAAPDCGDQRWPNFNLDTGTYKWVAYCGKDSLSGNVAVKTNTCTKVLVEFTFMPPDSTVTTETVCSLSSISYSGCLFLQCEVYETYEPLPNNVSAVFSAENVISLGYTSYAAGYPINSQNTVTFSANNIYINESTDKECYFITDPNGRVIEYHGLKHPEVIYPLDPIVVKYLYDAAGNLIKRTVYKADGITALKEINYVWQDGNIIQVVLKNLAGGGTTITDFDYYTDKPVKQYPFVFFDAFELLLFQPAINTGNHTKNPVKTQTLHATDINSNPVSLTYGYKNYVVDDNGYVIGFSITNGGSISTDLSFSYKCF